MSTSVYYKDAKLIDVNNNTKTLLTAGKYLEDNVILTDVTVYQTHTVTLTNSGSNYMAYIEHNGVSYYSSDDVIDVSDGDTIKIWLNYGNNNILYVNEEKIAEATAGMAIDYTYTVTSDVEIRFSLTFGTSSVSLTEISDIQALSVTENGTYTASGTTRGYSPVTVNVPNPLTSSLTVTPTETAQTFNATGVYGYKPVTVNAISSTYVGTGVATRSAANLTASGSVVTAPAGYYSSQVTKSVASATLATPAITLASATGVVTATENQTAAGYIAATSKTSTYTLTTQAAQTIYPSTADQTISSYRWLTGSQTIKSVTTSNLTAENIAEGVVVKVGDATNASRITQITGTHSGAPKYTATIISAGVSSAHDVPYCYVRYPGSSGSKYADLNTTIDFSPGDEMLLYAEGYSYTSPVSMYINDELVSYSTMVGSYLYTLPSCDINISLNAYTNPVGVKVYSPIIPSGTSEITSNGTYNVYGYSAANVSVSSNDFLVTLSQNAYGSLTIDKTFSEIISAFRAGKKIAAYGDGSPYYTGAIDVDDEEFNFVEVFGYSYSGNDYLVICEDDYALESNFSAFVSTKYYYHPDNMNATPSDVASGKRFINWSGFQVGTATGGGFTADDIAMRTISGDISGSTTRIYDYAFYSCTSLTTASFPNVTSIGSYAFYSCASLTTASFPSATYIGNYAFQYCTSLTTASFSSVSSVGMNTFYACYALTTASLPKLTNIPNNMFGYCTSLTTASFPSVTNIGSSAFQYCYALSTISFPNVRSIGSYAFRYCSSLTTASFPNAISIGSSAFTYCTALTTADFPSATSIGAYAFASCSVLATVSFPNVKSIGSYAFYGCHPLTIASFPSVTSISNSAFGYCYSFLSLYLLGSSVPTLGTGAFVSTPIGGYTTSTGGVYGSIFVPSSLYDQYIVATTWSAYSARIVSV